MYPVKITPIAAVNLLVRSRGLVGSATLARIIGDPELATAVSGGRQLLNPGVFTSLRRLFTR